MSQAASTSDPPLREALDAINRLERENRLLRQKLELLIARQFGGKKNEAIDPGQLELLLKGIEKAGALPPRGESEKPKAPRPAKRPARQKIPAHLETEEIVLEPEELKETPEGWRKLGEERTEELDWKPAKFIRRVYVRPKYVKGDQIVIAPLPNRLIEKGLPGPGLLTQVVLSKFEDHLPLYRQEKIYRERHGVSLRRQTMCDWMEQVAQWLRPVYREMKNSLLKGDYLQVDETPLSYLDSEVKGKSSKGFLWTYGRPGADVVFDWQISRGREGPREFLNGFAGKLQADGYGVYPSLCRENPKWKLFGCLAHARRKFHEARDEDRRAAWFLRQIGMLYAIEKKLRTDKAGPKLREPTRQWQARPILERIAKAIDVIQPKVLPQSRLGQSLSYAREQWPLLEKYVDHGEVEADNNLIENAIRPTALGKKNWLFIGSPEAGWRSAVIYSILGSCRRHGINPSDYLADIFQRLPDMKQSEIAEITPAAWAKARSLKN